MVNKAIILQVDGLKIAGQLYLYPQHHPLVVAIKITLS